MIDPAKAAVEGRYVRLESRRGRSGWSRLLVVFVVVAATAGEGAHPLLRITWCGVARGIEPEHDGELYRWPGRPPSERNAVTDKYLPAGTCLTACNMLHRVAVVVYPEGTVRVRPFLGRMVGNRPPDESRGNGASHEVRDARWYSYFII